MTSLSICISIILGSSLSTVIEKWIAFDDFFFRDNLETTGTAGDPIKNKTKNNETEWQ